MPVARSPWDNKHQTSPNTSRYKSYEDYFCWFLKSVLCVLICCETLTIRGAILAWSFHAGRRKARWLDPRHQDASRNIQMRRRDGSGAVRWLMSTLRLSLCRRGNCLSQASWGTGFNQVSKLSTTFFHIVSLHISHHQPPQRFCHVSLAYSAGHLIVLLYLTSSKRAQTYWSSNTDLLINKAGHLLQMLTHFTPPT